MSFNVLIVDDSATTRGIVKKVLQLSELPLGSVQEAGNGIQALAVLRRDWVDLVLADLNMPEMGGLELIETMAKDPLLAGVPVVVVSSEGNQTVIDSLASKGTRGFIRKPCEPAMLRRVIEGALNARV
ncbi:MAG TPA: response regulator [bacterium]|jgi:two-component system chemotaxis response regulator CheY|nr:response regulator [bacterium]